MTTNSTNTKATAAATTTAATNAATTAAASASANASTGTASNAALTQKGDAAPTSATKPGSPNSKSSSSSSSSGGFKATLTVFDMVVYGLIFMVPIAPFAIYGQVFDASNGMPALAYVIAMVAMLFTALSFGVMVPIFPSSGSIFTYTSRGMGKGIGFVTGWLMILQYIITPDVMYIMAGNALAGVPGLGHIPIWVWCLLFLAFVTLVSLRGIGTTMIIDRIALIGELIVLGLFIGFSVFFIIQGHNDAAFSATAVINPPEFNVGVMFSAVSLCALSFVGFGSVATLTEESKAGPMGPGRAMLIIVLVLGALFFTMCFVATCADPSGNIMKSNPTNGFYVLAGVVGGEWFMITCEIANVLALGVFTGLAAQTSIARILYVMGQAGAMPKKFGRMNNRTNTPTVATLFVSLVSLVLLVPLIFVGQDIAAKFSNFGALSSYCLLNICVIWYCFIKRKEHKPFRHLIFPVLGAVITGIILVSLGWLPITVGVVWAVIGIVVYLYATRVRHHTIDLS